MVNLLTYKINYYLSSHFNLFYITFTVTVCTSRCSYQSVNKQWSAVFLKSPGTRQTLVKFTIASILILTVLHFKYYLKIAINIY